MSEAQWLSPLAHRVVETAGLVLSIEDRSSVGMIDLRILGDNTKALTVAGKVSGTGLPLEPRTSTASDEVTCLWFSVDQWLVTCERSRAAELSQSLSKALEGHFASVTDVSDMRAVIRLTGESARQTLMKCVSIDILSAAVQPGYVRRVNFGEIAAALHMVSNAPDSFDLYVFRSYASYALDWLEEAARESAAIGTPFGPSSAPPV